MIKALHGILTELWNVGCNDDCVRSFLTVLRAFTHTFVELLSELKWGKLRGTGWWEVGVVTRALSSSPRGMCPCKALVSGTGGRGGEFHLLRQQGMATCWVPAIRAGPAHEVCLTSKRIIQLFSLFDYGQSPDLPFACEPQCIWPISGSTWTQLICCQRAGLGVECLTVASQSTNYSLKDINIWFLYLAAAYWIFFFLLPQGLCMGCFLSP